MRGEGLRADPQLKFGTLANGMRYVIRRNKTPAGEASVRLRIDTGSLNEADDQRGVAHFLEHMVLNGTENVPEGDFVKRLERAGLRFGPDTNASTGFGQTVFKLELAANQQGDPGRRRSSCFAKWPGKATIDAGALDRERGIILSEERARATPGYPHAERPACLALPRTAPARAGSDRHHRGDPHRAAPAPARLLSRLVSAGAGNPGHRRRCRSGRHRTPAAGAVRRLERGRPRRHRRPTRVAPPPAPPKRALFIDPAFAAAMR